MTVAEMIAVLKKIDPESLVLVADANGDRCLAVGVQHGFARKVSETSDYVDFKRDRFDASYSAAVELI